MTTDHGGTQLVAVLPTILLVIAGLVLIGTGERTSGIVLILAAAGCETKAYVVQHANTNRGSQTASPTTASAAESPIVTSLAQPKAHNPELCGVDLDCKCPCAPCVIMTHWTGSV